MPRKDAGGGPISAQAQQDLVSEGIENFELPKSLVTKIAKSALPDNAKLQNETVLSLVKGSTVFINYLAATAHDVALSKQHKSISASDVLKALEMIEFGDLVDPLQHELEVYRDNTKGDKNRKSGVDRTNSSSKGKAKEGENRPSASRSKGKAKGPLPSPFTTLPRPVVPSSVSHTIEDVNMGVLTGDVGTECGPFHIGKIRDEYFTFLTECTNPKACKILLRGPSKDILNEIYRNLADALSVARNVYFNPVLTPGGGATEWP